MSVLRSLCIAFSVYSKIPVPYAEWDAKNMKYVFCFLPLVGAVIGAAFVAWFFVCERLGIGRACFAAVAAAIPVMINGGIHMDGFIDTSDALASYGSKEKLWEIMDDPHAGAFGIIKAILYFLLCFGFFTEIDAYGSAAITALGFVMSRAVCAVIICTVGCAKNGGMLHTFAKKANKTAVMIAACAAFAACAAAAIYINAFTGAAAAAGFVMLFIWHRLLVNKRFGGITGDTCGRLIKQCELLTLVIAVIGGKLF